MMRRAWRRLPGVVLLAMLASCGLAVASTASGSRRGSALFRAENRALARVHTINFTGTSAALDSALGKQSYAHWLWAPARVPAGFVRARMHGTIAVSHGRVVWTRVELVPEASATCGRLCHQIAVVVIGERSGTFFAYGTLAHHGCLELATGPYLSSGTSLATPAGHFSAPRDRGADVLLTFRYPWLGTRTATETDTITRSTDLPRSEVSADHADPAYAIRQSFSYAARQALPSVTERCISASSRRRG
jgi:hypothetical protein